MRTHLVGEIQYESKFTYVHCFYVQVRLYAPPDRVEQTLYALQVAVTSVDLYTEMFNLSYPLPKLGKYI